MKKRNFIHLPKKAGYSLLELLIVLALSGVTLGISIPELHSIRKRGELQRICRQVEHLLLRSRQRAMAEGRRYEILVSQQQLSVFRHLTDEPLEIFPLPEGISFTPQSSPIQIYKTGTTSPRRLELERPTVRCEIFLSLRGRTRFTCHSS